MHFLKIKSIKLCDLIIDWAQLQLHRLPGIYEMQREVCVWIVIPLYNVAQALKTFFSDVPKFSMGVVQWHPEYQNHVSGKHIFRQSNTRLMSYPILWRFPSMFWGWEEIRFWLCFSEKIHTSEILEQLLPFLPGDMMIPCSYSLVDQSGFRFNSEKTWVKLRACFRKPLRLLSLENPAVIRAEKPWYLCEIAFSQWQSYLKQVLNLKQRGRKFQWLMW